MARNSGNRALLLLFSGIVLVIFMITILSQVNVGSMIALVANASGGSAPSDGKSLSGSLGQDIASFLKDPEGLALPPDLDGILLQKEGFVLVYSTSLRVPLWVGYELTGQEVRGDLPREDNFKKDPDLGDDSPSASSYQGSGYDRGHMIPAGDVKWSEAAMEESFLMSNVVPQLPSLNRGPWKALEEAVRELAEKEGALIIITGPVITAKQYPGIEQAGSIIPEYFFKVVLDYSEPGLAAWGFIFPNNDKMLEGREYRDFLFSVDQVEQYTGYDFFALLPDEIEADLEESESPVF